MRPLWVIAQKEISGVFKERTILLAVVIQVVVAGFSSFLVVGLSALVDPSAFPSQAHSTVALNEAASNDTALFNALQRAGLAPITAQVVNSTLSPPSGPGGGVRGPFGAAPDAQIIAAFRAGYYDAAILRDSTTNETVNLTILLPEGTLRTTLTVVQVKDALEDYERDLRGERQARLAFEPTYVNTEAKGGSYGFVYSLLIPLLVFLPVVLAGALCADSITEEVQRKTLPLLLASPATPADVVEGKLLANSLVAPLLAIAWFLLLGLNGLTVPLAGALLILVFATALAYLLGLLACGIALATRDRNKAHVTYASAMFLLLGLSLALPTSPVNAVALLAAGSPTAGAYSVVLGTVALAAVGALGLRIALRRTQQWMAAGSVS